ncbi:hypothetical protein Ddye_013425 [Dipteronia dyeriana]|uniref:pectinesterase n=1 Tax=Dipteronia dyeriana TaxID=168575 RepID=A0AAD9X699_9ROSI|nr:hypothetical protein Ddye_013425 [Dipteronia dyeriana]
MEAEKFTISRSLLLSCNVIFALLFLSFVLFISNLQTTMASATTLKSTTKTYKTFIKNQCSSTTYPSDCYKSLSSYAATIKTNPVNLCNTSLYVTLKAARSYYVSISSLTKQKGLNRNDKGIVKDCVDELGDCIDELTQSLNAMKNLGGSYEEIQFQLSNIKTWVSASITDEDTCTDGFVGRKVNSNVKKQITKCIKSLTMMTSNSLALINSLNNY